jgi:hypothetical protein
MAQDASAGQPLDGTWGWPEGLDSLRLSRKPKVLLERWLSEITHGFGSTVE